MKSLYALLASTEYPLSDHGKGSLRNPGRRDSHLISIPGLAFKSKNNWYNQWLVSYPSLQVRNCRMSALNWVIWDFRGWSANQMTDGRWPELNNNSYSNSYSYSEAGLFAIMLISSISNFGHLLARILNARKSKLGVVEKVLCHRCATCGIWPYSDGSTRLSRSLNYSNRIKDFCCWNSIGFLVL